MTPFVLVPGGTLSTDTWNRLTGRQDYPDGGMRPPAFVPLLADEHTHNLTDHIGQICTLLVEEGLTEVILVGHRYGGMVITGVAARMPVRIRHLVC